MQQLSYPAADPIFDVARWRLSAQIITYDNVYGLDPDRTTAARTDGRTVIGCDRLTWAGGLERASGSARIEAQETDDGLEVIISARHERSIRCVKLNVAGLPKGELIGAFWGQGPLPRSGVVLSYPTPLHTPLVFLAAADGSYVYFRSMDRRVRAKRFAFFDTTDGVTAELIVEDAANEMSNSVTTSAWRLGRCVDPDRVVADHAASVAQAHGLEPWEARRDVPGWAREIALVATIHGMHWSGYVFNDYDGMLRALRWIAERIEGRRVLAFLPGWEGRYYWQYGDYRPDSRLGGEQGFARLVAGAGELGVHLMPMFGMNCANRALPDFESWGAPAVLRSPGGLVFHGNRPDWDASRAHDPGWQAWLNPGAPAWRDHLIDQVSRLVGRYQLPAVFFDTQHVWINDPQYPVYEGIVAVRDTLKARFPDLLLAGEGWYDALGAATPVSQVGATARWPEFFGKHCRTFLHLSAGDPSRGSTGVHELGHAPFRLAPDAPYVWPTLPIVDGTLERAPERAAEVIAQAKRYAAMYLS